MEFYLRSVLAQLQKPYIVFGMLIGVIGFWGLSRLVKHRQQQELFHLLKDKTYKKSFRFFRGFCILSKRLLQALLLTLLILGIFGGLLQNELHQSSNFPPETLIAFRVVTDSILAFIVFTYAASLLLVISFTRLTRKENDYSYCFKTIAATETLPAETEIFLVSRLDEDTFLCVYFNEEEGKVFIPLSVEMVMTNEFYLSERYAEQTSWFKQLRENLSQSQKIAHHLLTFLLASILTFLLIYGGAGLAGGLSFDKAEEIFRSAPPYYWIICTLPLIFYLFVIVSIKINQLKSNKTLKDEEKEIKKPRRKKRTGTDPN